MTANNYPEAITLEEAADISGFTRDYLRDLAKKAGMTRIGNKSLIRQEFFNYWMVRCKELDQPKQLGESGKMRLERINKTWKDLVSKFGIK